MEKTQQEFYENQEIAINNNFYHIWGMLFFWTIGIDLGIILVRQLKTFRYYTWVHGLFFMPMDFSTIYITYTQLKYRSYRDQIFQDTIVGNIHLYLGILVTLLIAISHFGGVALKFLVESFFGRKDYIQGFKTYHKYNSYVLYVLGKIQVLVGALKYDSIYGTYYSIIAVNLIVFAAIMTVFSSHFLGESEQENKNLIKYNKKPQKRNKKSNEQLMQMINEGKDRHEIIKENEKVIYAIYGNKVIDLSSFMHPGGNYILTQTNGREIDRFIFGGYALEGDNRQPYIHSFKSEKYMLEHQIGELSFPNSQNVLHNKENSYSNVWKLSEIQDISSTTSLFLFENSEYFTFKNYLKGVQWIGRYFTISKSSDITFQRRLYTTVQCMSSSNIQYRKKLIEFVNSDFDKQKAPQKMPEHDNNLPFVIKNYASFKNQTLSSKIFKGKSQEFSIQGPQGIGLNLRQNSEGKYVIICGGTGILPFLDLINFVHQKIIYQIALKYQGKEFAEKYIDVHNIGLQENLNNFQLIVYAAFKNMDEFLGKEIILSLVSLTNQYGLEKQFQFFAKFQDSKGVPKQVNIVKRFDKSLFEEHAEYLEQAQKIWICGPPNMNSGVQKDLISLKKYENIIEFI